jgi:hypothetical protein
VGAPVVAEAHGEPGVADAAADVGQRLQPAAGVPERPGRQVFHQVRSEDRAAAVGAVAPHGLGEVIDVVGQLLHLGLVVVAPAVEVGHGHLDGGAQPQPLLGHDPQLRGSAAVEFLGDVLAQPRLGLARPVEQVGEQVLVGGEHRAAEPVPQLGVQPGVGVGAHPGGPGGVVGPGDGRQLLGGVVVAELHAARGGDHPRVVALAGVRHVPRAAQMPDQPAVGDQAGLLGQLPAGGVAVVLAGLDDAAGQRPAVAVAAVDHQQPAAAGDDGGDDRVGGLRLAPAAELVAAADPGVAERVDRPAVLVEVEPDQRVVLALLPVDCGGVGLGVGPAVADAGGEHVGVGEGTHDQSFRGLVMTASCPACW